MRVHRRIVRDYRLALGLTMAESRDHSGLSFAEMANRTGIPEQTLRSYERGSYHPQIQRLIALAQVFDTSMFEILQSASAYIYRASGLPTPDPARDGDFRVRQIALLLYCGASTDDVSAIETAGW